MGDNYCLFSPKKKKKKKKSESFHSKQPSTFSLIFHFSFLTFSCPPFIASTCHLTEKETGHRRAKPTRCLTALSNPWPFRTCLYLRLSGEHSPWTLKTLLHVVHREPEAPQDEMKISCSNNIWKANWEKRALSSPPVINGSYFAAMPFKRVWVSRNKCVGIVKRLGSVNGWWWIGE